MATPTLPPGWHEQAHAAWKAGQPQLAIDHVLGALNRKSQSKPLPLVLQLAYYIFLTGDALGAARFLQQTLPEHPDNTELLLNLSVCLGRGGAFDAALGHLERLLALEPDNVVGLDTLCHCLHRTGRTEEAAAAGTRVLAIKDAQHASVDANWQLPQGTPDAWASQAGKTPVIAFSLWGNKPRYLRGAIDNALQAKVVYPDWTLRFYVDSSVPLALRQALGGLGADVRVQPDGQPMLQRLGWRFLVANDPTVGRFLVRDVDSVVNLREKAAVDQWLQSGQWFHAMRDWWTHTDLVLAGMWGGVANVLPPLDQQMATYVSAQMETPNIDQWFLRDVVWRWMRSSCLVHDRCFSPPGAVPWPGPHASGNVHVGQDVYAVDKQKQVARIQPWIDQLACLQESPTQAPHSPAAVPAPSAAAARAPQVEKTRINIATPAYGSKYASVYLHTFFALLSGAAARNVAFTFAEIDYADIVTARNYLVSNFYFNCPDESHLLFVDDDMGFDPALLYDMLELNQPLVGVLAPRRQFSPEKMFAQDRAMPADQAYALASDFVGAPSNPKERGSFVKVKQCGTGIMLISRECIRTMIEKCPDIVDARRYKKMPFANQFSNFITPFNKVELEDKELSEDFSFCHRWVHHCGGTIFANTSRQVQHVGQMVVNTRYDKRWGK